MRIYKKPAYQEYTAFWSGPQHWFGNNTKAFLREMTHNQVAQAVRSLIYEVITDLINKD